MRRLIVNQNMFVNTEDSKAELMKLCPFGAINVEDGKVEITSLCKMCKLCIKKGPTGLFEYLEETTNSLDKSLWRGFAVYVEHTDGKIHPVTFELIGKARELASKINHPVYCLLIGSDVADKAEELLYYGIDEVFVYDFPALQDFRIEPYTAAFENFIKKIQPSTILLGATSVGRTLAARVAARFKTGLTADCTILDVKDNSDLVQIRPAFGGNIMAQIITPNHRPQLATVRYKIMDTPEKNNQKSGKITICELDAALFTSKIKVLNITQKAQEQSISDAEVIVVAGRGVKSEKDMEMVTELAKQLGGQVASTRPLIEAGWVSPKKQIGLSGRTVRPKLLITCGVSGAVQFTAGMNNAENIIAINKDKKAPIFQIAHYGIVGDLYEVVPKLIAKIKAGRGSSLDI